MKVYRLMCNSDEFCTLSAVKKENQYSDETDGKVKNDWKKYDVKIGEYDKRTKKKIGDFTAIAVTPVFSEKTKELLFNSDTREIQFLPVHCVDNNEDYYIANVINVIDCVDYEKSEVTRFSSGRIMQFDKYEFIQEKLVGINIFKIIDEPESVPFITEELKNKIIQNRLTGFRLILVWDSEAE